MYYSMPNYGYGYGCMPQYNVCGGTNRNNGNSYALILVLFILLAIIGTLIW